MANIRSHRGNLFFDFRYQGVRCREYTKLKNTASNRKTMQKVANKIETDIALGVFNYATYFPNSSRAKSLGHTAPRQQGPVSQTGRTQTPPSNTPFYADFAETWFNENQPLWRRSHIDTLRSTLDRHLIPAFGAQAVSIITKADTLAFRAELVKLPGRSGNSNLSAKTVNRVMQIHCQIMAEASERFDFNNPADRIKRLKQRRIDIHPFSLEEVQLMVGTVRPDFHDYFILRFFTGMRTGEINGLQWKYIDFERQQILVRETWVRNQIEYTKTDGSQREIDMSQPVYEALQRQFHITGQKSPFVFCNRDGSPTDLNNFTNRVWYPLLRYLSLEKRRPYQTRHTTATLWLGAGENPEWVARQLGHTNTEMLFKTYSRFIPNLTRQDGSAMDRLLASRLLNNTTQTHHSSL